jgi:nicotinamide mononucleotide transporter
MLLFYADIYQSSWDYLLRMDYLEVLGVVFGLLCVWLLIKENILTWPAGILYIFISFIIFWEQRLYGDFLLHVFFLVLNIYGWYYWVKGKRNKNEEEVPVTSVTPKFMIVLLAISGIAIYLFGLFLEILPSYIEGLSDASLPYWDSTTSILSVSAMWLTARKKIENWYLWLVVDILATGIYFYKGIHFYALLYFIYIILAVSGYLVWKKSLEEHRRKSSLG